MFNFKKKTVLPILTVKNTVFFPGTVMPFMIGREKSLNLIDEVIKTGTVFGIVAQKDVNIEDPKKDNTTLLLKV